MVTALAGCRSGTITEDLAYRVLFYGQVTTNAGAPIVGAPITIRHFPGSCIGGGAEQESTQTDANGKFRKELTILTSADGCVRLKVTAAGFAADSVTLTTVPFVLPPALDSVGATIVLQVQ